MRSACYTTTRITVPESSVLPSVVLASASPQRKALLLQIGVEALCVPADIDESILDGESAQMYVQRLACEKCQVVAQSYPDAIVIAADTTISIGEKIIAKAESLEQGQEILSLLSGKQHSVLTGVAFFYCGALHQLVCETLVDFRQISADEIVAYWNSGEPQGKAGCYAIQGMGAIFIERIRGSYSNVVGLPLSEVAGQLTLFGYPLLRRSSV